MRYAVDLGDGLGDLLDSASLLLAAGIDSLNQFLHLGGALGDGDHHFRHLVHFLGAFLRFGDGFVHERRRILGRLGGALRQAADLVGDNREAHTSLTGPRRFHRGVERQNICLKSNLVDDFDNGGDLRA